MHSIRQPAYTGENRCLPCTAVNLFIAVVISLLLASLSIFVGAATFVVSLGLIYLRGYLVPGTPELTANYLPSEALRLFGKEPESTVAADEFERLSSMNVVVPCDGGSTDSTCLAPEFRDAWQRRIESTDPERIGPRDVADLLGVAEGDVSSIGERAFVVSGDRLVHWPSSAALVADVAAGAELSARSDRSVEWGEMEPDAREESLTRLRTFLSDCPTCGATLTRDEHRVSSCCQPSKTVFTSTCEGCGAHIVELDGAK
ncbi:hypothetical protein [Haladaptatus sp.]|uniref:hypothetical protein n=1 Tax=Haladaptatus sp. TaxID=1973141 RepID=UPI003C4711F6